MDEVEQLLFHCEECNVYKLPPRQSGGGHRASEWQDHMIWTGQCKVISKGSQVTVQLMEANGNMFATCPMQTGPNAPKSMESVQDSSRYFVLRIEHGGKHAHVGIGFGDRDEAFDFKVAITDQQRQDEKNAKPVYCGPKQDLSMKSGEKIVVAISGKVKAADKKKTGAGGGFSLAPPPSGGARPGALAPPPSGGPRVAPPPSSSSAARVAPPPASTSSQPARPASPKAFGAPAPAQQPSSSANLFGQHKPAAPAPTAGAGADLFGASPFPQPSQPQQQNLFPAQAAPAAAVAPGDLFGKPQAQPAAAKRQDPNAGLFGASVQAAPGAPVGGGTGDFLFAEKPKPRPSVEDLFACDQQPSPQAAAQQGPPSLPPAGQQQQQPFGSHSPPPQHSPQDLFGAPAPAQQFPQQPMGDLFAPQTQARPQAQQPATAAPAAAAGGNFLDLGPAPEQAKASVLDLFGAPAQQQQQPAQQGGGNPFPF
eukprot:TRINITY_DN5253_c0_g1_i1.p1 TRINITY_DN5253_c0_g1~~TRINITY_DN5253_c0_g1_i1.p1  ORF type:complete len:480 (+),score=150.66 TRINITY_DN5253_c0_g1_i1:79-1518(+)